MRAGPRRHRITVQSRNGTTGPTGELVPKYTTIDTVWCQVVTKGSREFRLIDQTVTETTHVFKCGYRPDFADARNRVQWQGQDYDLTGEPFDPHGRERELWLPAKRVA